jgi:hypothetical protein
MTDVAALLAFDGGEGGIATWFAWMLGVLILGGIALIALAVVLMAIVVAVVMLVRRTTGRSDQVS